MKRTIKYLAGSALILALVAAMACGREEPPAPPAPAATEPTAAMAPTQAMEATAAPTTDEATSMDNQGDSRLDAVRARDKVICASRNDVPGYGFLDDNGNNVGFDIDLCRALPPPSWAIPTRSRFA